MADAARLAVKDNHSEFVCDLPSGPKSSSLSKHAKGRLKKLQKRANTINVHQRISGIASRHEWNELLQLTQARWGVDGQNDAETGPKITGPFVSWRQSTARACVEGAENRDILFTFLETGTDTKNNLNEISQDSGKKRKRQQDKANNSKPCTAPSWATVQNPGAVSHVAVIEFHLDSSCSDEDYKELEGRLVQSCTNEKYNRGFLKTKSRWFPATTPKSISDSLMYSSKASENLSGQGAPVIGSKDGLAQALRGLTMTVGELKKECYPRAQNVGSKDDAAEKLLEQIVSPCKPSTISHDSACTLLKHFHVQVDPPADSKDSLPPFVSTPPAGPSLRSNAKPRIFALDCEMVKTTAGSELARVTLVEATSFLYGSSVAVETKVIWDELIRPVHAVVDYVTEYSGITASMMKDVTLTLEQVQAALLRTVSSDDIVVGHSLENDMKASRWIHPLVVDTAVLFRAEHGRFKYSLRHLAATLLRRQIQCAGRPHCSEEDAVAALQLAVRRAVEGPAFAIRSKSQTNRLAALSQGSVGVCVGPSKWLVEHVTSQPNSIHALSCENIRDSNREAVVSWLTPKRRARLVWANWNISKSSSDLDASVGLVEDLISKADNLDTVVAVCLQRGYQKAASLSLERRARLKPKATIPWSDKDEQEWGKSIETCRVGTVMWIGGKRLN